MKIPPTSPLHNTLQSPNEQGRHTYTCRHQLLPLVENVLLGNKLVYSCTQVCTCICLQLVWTLLQVSSCSWSKVWLPWMQAMFLPGSALQYRLMRKNRDLCYQLVGPLAIFPVTHKKSDVHLGSRSCPPSHMSFYVSSSLVAWLHHSHIGSEAMWTLPHKSLPLAPPTSPSHKPLPHEFLPLAPPMSPSHMNLSNELLPQLSPSH